MSAVVGLGARRPAGSCPYAGPPLTAGVPAALAIVLTWGAGVGVAVPPAADRARSPTTVTAFT